MVEVRLARGVHLPELPLWLDPRRRAPMAFVSHAHSDHTGRHEVTIATPTTLDLMALRMGRLKGELIPMDFGESREFDGFTIRLLPAGHVLGSAQCHIETEEGSVLYTGDFKRRASATSEAAGFCHAGTLVMETTFGLPKYVFPPAEAVLSGIVEFCKSALAAGATPALLAYSLGKAQEVLSALGAAGLTSMPHSSIVKLLPVYERAGYVFPGLVEWSDRRDAVIVCPPSSRNSLRGIADLRTAVVTGWALDSATVFRSRCDAAFPLSDHAGYDDLLRHVEDVAPSRVLTLHGFAQEFARDLRSRGIEAWALTGPNQLELPL